MKENLNLYFDNAATTYPKPEKVYNAAEETLRKTWGNPGRSGHTRTLDADRLVYRVRESIARLFNAPDPSAIVFTLNATDALNMAIKGVLEPGDHVIFTAMEHNSVLRPLGAMRRCSIIETTMAPCSPEGFPDLDFLAGAFKSRTRLLVVNHASNVCGAVAPLQDMIEMAHSNGALVLVDAAQSAGILPVDVTANSLDMLAFAGHKGLMGPPGTGGLFVRPGLNIKPWREGGTGSFSEKDQHPESMPERLEAGTLNIPGLAGLLQGIDFIRQTGLEKIRKYERALLEHLRQNLSTIPGVSLFGPSDISRSVAVLSFTLSGADCGEVGGILESNYNILCRTGLHCAPHAHRTIGTFPRGTVRISPGFFTRDQDIDYLTGALAEVAALAGAKK